MYTSHAKANLYQQFTLILFHHYFNYQVVLLQLVNRAGSILSSYLLENLKMFWKSRRHENTVIALTSWLYLIVRFFGLWSFTIESNATVVKSKGECAVCIKLLDWLWAVITFSYYCISTVIQIGAIAKFQELNSTLIEIVINNVTIVSDILIALLCIIMDIVNRKRLWKMILIFHEFDVEVLCSSRTF